MEDEKPVTLGISLIDKKITMTSSSVNELTVEVYLTSEDAAEGQLLAKAMNLQGQEIAARPANVPEDICMPSFSDVTLCF